MRNFNLVVLGSAAALWLVAGTGCGHKGASTTEAATALEQSFEKTEPAAKQAVAAATAALQAAATGDIESRRTHYLEALRPMENLAARGDLSREQMQAVHKVFLHVQQAVQRNPALAKDKDLYRAQAALAKRLYHAGVRP